MDKLHQWRQLRNELDDMFKAREKKYAEVVKDYYAENPKDFSEKKSKKKSFAIDKKRMSDVDSFSYENCVEKKYWKKRPKNENPSEVELKDDHPDMSRIEAAIAFFEKLKVFVASKNCPKPEQWLAERFGQGFMDRFRKQVINPIKQEQKDQLFSLPKNELGMDEFDS